jgi:malonyl-CoA O-methyltransferase
MNFKAEICNSFNNKASGYEKAAKIQNEIGMRMFDRLDYLAIKPQYILDLGCGTGIFSALLKKKYPKAQVLGLDLAFSMLEQSQKKLTLWRKWQLVNADMTKLPFASGIFDLIFANQVIHWSESLSPIFSELNRVMKVNGCLMFSTLGPDTFKEIRTAWKGDNFSHTNHFTDLHDIGDILVKERFLDPVMDMELLTAQYSSVSLLARGLQDQGVRNINPNRNKGLTSKSAWESFEKGYYNQKTKDGKYPLTYEVVYGHAWKGEQRQVGEMIETVIPVSKIHRK